MGRMQDKYQDARAAGDVIGLLAVADEYAAHGMKKMASDIRKSASRLA
jgi:hypothetical protein